MKLIIHTKYGKFEGKEQPFDEKKYNNIAEYLLHVHKLDSASFETEDGKIFMLKEMLNDCIVQLIK